MASFSTPLAIPATYSTRAGMRTSCTIVQLTCAANYSSVFAVSHKTGEIIVDHPSYFRVAPDVVRQLSQNAEVKSEDEAVLTEEYSV